MAVITGMIIFVNPELWNQSCLLTNFIYAFSLVELYFGQTWQKLHVNRKCGMSVVQRVDFVSCMTIFYLGRQQSVKKVSDKLFSML